MKRLDFILIFLFLLAIALPFGCSGSDKSNTEIQNYEQPPQPSYPTYYVGEDYDLGLVYKYSASLTKGRIIRWNKSIINVYDGVGVPGLQENLDDWNQYLPYIMALSTNETTADIKIVGDPNFYANNSGYCGRAQGNSINYETVYFLITLDTSPDCNFIDYWGKSSLQAVAKHELGHTVGFYGHTNGYVMCCLVYTTSTDQWGNTYKIISSYSFLISEEVQRTIIKLYTLPPGSYIVP